MDKDQLLSAIHTLYVPYYERLTDFIYALEGIDNEDIRRSFIIASLRVVEAIRIKSEYPVIANLLCYIAIETLSNTIAYFVMTKGEKHTDFTINFKIEKKINKTKEFINFIDEYCPESLKSNIKFKKYINDKECAHSFKDILRFLYQKNRCYIVHKGLFRNIEHNSSYVDVFIDEQGKKCAVSISTVQCSLENWLCETVKRCFVSFLKDNYKDD